MRALLLSACLIASLKAGSASAGTERMGLGALPCQTAFALEDRDDYRRRLAQWVSGYVSAANDMLPERDRRSFVDQHPDDLVAEIIARCMFEDPFEPIATAARKLFVYWRRTLPPARK